MECGFSKLNSGIGHVLRHEARLVQCGAGVVLNARDKCQEVGPPNPPAAIHVSLGRYLRYLAAAEFSGVDKPAVFRVVQKFQAGIS